MDVRNHGIAIKINAHLLSTTQLGSIDSDKQSFDTPFFCMLDNTLGNISLLIDVSRLR
jgi:hypothetical protein